MVLQHTRARRAWILVACGLVAAGCATGTEGLRDTTHVEEGRGEDAGADPSPPAVDDLDGDGFRIADGDCDDQDPNRNPGALDTLGNGIDEDCNGAPDDAPVGCDAALATIADDSAIHAAQAMGICKMASGDSWGLISARYVRADGSEGIHPKSRGLLPNFGPNVSVQEGARMLALSSGTARRPGDDGYYPPTGSTYMVPGGFNAGTHSATPPGFPTASAWCNTAGGGDTNAIDPAGLEVVLRVPTNARSVRFRTRFFAAEFPSYVCGRYNDSFVALQTPAPAAAVHGNVSFDSKGNAISVNNAFLTSCIAQRTGGNYYSCPDGVSALAGTGFEERGATDWLETNTPVVPGSEVTFRFVVWDAADGIYDATVLLDAFEFLADDAEAPVTVPVL